MPVRMEVEVRRNIKLANISRDVPELFGEFALDEEGIRPRRGITGNQSVTVGFK